MHSNEAHIADHHRDGQTARQGEVIPIRTAGVGYRR